MCLRPSALHNNKRNLFPSCLCSATSQIYFSCSTHKLLLFQVTNALRLPHARENAKVTVYVQQVERRVAAAVNGDIDLYFCTCNLFSTFLYYVARLLAVCRQIEISQNGATNSDYDHKNVNRTASAITSSYSYLFGWLKTSN